MPKSKKKKAPVIEEEQEESFEEESSDSDSYVEDEKGVDYQGAKMEYELSGDGDEEEDDSY